MKASAICGAFKASYTTTYSGHLRIVHNQLIFLLKIDYLYENMFSSQVKYIQNNLKHIIFVCDHMSPAPSGGIGSFVTVLANHLKSRGIRVTVIGVYDKKYSVNCNKFPVVRVDTDNTTIEKIFLKVIAWKCRSWEINTYYKRLILRRKLWHAIAQIQKNEPAQIIEYPTYKGPYYRNVRGSCSILRLHGAETLIRENANCRIDPHARAEFETTHGIKTWIGPSEWSIKVFSNTFDVEPLITEIIPNPIDCDLFHPTERKLINRIVLFVGSFNDHKGDLRLAAAANRFLQNHQDVYLRFIGPHDTKRAVLIYENIERKFHNRIVLSNYLEPEKIAEVMRKSALLVLPSRSETFGIVCAEAAASGIPVVAGNNSAIPEIVVNGETGILVNSEEPKEIADAVEQLLTREDIRDRMGFQGRRRAEKLFAIEVIADRNLSFFQKCFDKMYH